MEKAYEKYAWILLFFVGIFLLLVGSGEILSGEFVDPQVGENLAGKPREKIRSDPYATFLARAHGLVVIECSILTMTIAAFGYRRGEKWAWYVSWTIPAVILGALTLDLTAEGRVWPNELVLAIVSVIGLVLPYRKFFPRK